MNTFELAETFLMIADMGSIQKAAKKMQQTEAAVSKKLKKLEIWLNTELLIRKRTGLILTEAGECYYKEAKKAIVQFQEAENSLKSQQKMPQGALHVVSNQYYSQQLIFPQLASFLKKYPKIDLRLSIAEILPDFDTHFSTGKVDILWGCSAPGDENLVRKRIQQTQYVLCASPNYLKRRGIPTTLSELQQHDFIAHAARKSPQVILLDNHQQIAVTPKVMINNTAMMIKACLQDIGFIWAHKNMASQWISEKKLVCFLEKYTQETIDIYAYYEYHTFVNPCVKAFMQFFSH